MSAYWLAIFLTAIFWTVFFIRFPSARRKMIIFGLLFTPLVIVDVLTIPFYWKPITLFNLPIGFEGFLFTFFLIGIAVFFAKTRKKKPSKKRRWDLGLVGILSVFITLLVFWLKLHGMYLVLLILLITAVVYFVLYPHSRKKLVLTSLAFGIFYYCVFSFWAFISNGLNYWNPNDFLAGNLIGKVPLGEVLFGFFLGGAITSIERLFTEI